MGLEVKDLQEICNFFEFNLSDNKLYYKTEHLMNKIRLECQTRHEIIELAFKYHLDDHKTADTIYRILSPKYYPCFRKPIYDLLWEEVFPQCSKCSGNLQTIPQQAIVKKLNLSSSQLLSNHKSIANGNEPAALSDGHGQPLLGRINGINRISNAKMHLGNPSSS